MIELLLVVGHLFGGFYLNEDTPERIPLRKLPLRAAAYMAGLAAAPLVFLRVSELPLFLTFVLAAGALHGALAWLGLSPGRRPLWFLVRQSVLLLFLFLGSRLLSLSGGEQLRLAGHVYETASFVGPAGILLGVLLCGRPASFFVRLVLFSLQSDFAAGEASGGNPSIGAYIGILEREIIFLLGVLGQFGAIGFVLTAKSVARFKQLEDRAFAEKYLVGTLLSAAVALACAGLYRHLLGG